MTREEVWIKKNPPGTLCRFATEINEWRYDFGLILGFHVLHEKYEHTRTVYRTWFVCIMNSRTSCIEQLVLNNQVRERSTWEKIHTIDI